MGSFQRSAVLQNCSHRYLWLVTDPSPLQHVTPGFCNSVNLCELVSEGAYLSPFTEFTETDEARLGHGPALLNYYSFSSVYPILPFLISNSKSKPPLFVVLFPLIGWFHLWASFSSLPGTHFVAQVGLKLFCFLLLIKGMSDLNDAPGPAKQLFLFVCLCYFGLHSFFFPLELSPPYCHSHLYVIWLLSSLLCPLFISSLGDFG